MDTKQLVSMVTFVVGFLLLWAAMRMFYAVVRPRVAQVSPPIAEAVDFVLL